VMSLLYLEDDDALAFVTQRALERRGFQVTHYASVTAALKGLVENEFDAALLDLKVGNETSLELIATIKKQQDIPIVLVTGYGSIQTAVQAIKLGAVNYLSKPCSIDDIVAALGENTTEVEVAEELDLMAPSLRRLEWEAIQKALDENDGNISATARQLKMHRRTLQRKLNKRILDC
jgi:two-component system, response regulator RegA